MQPIKNNKPRIGIILDFEEKGTFSDFPYFALRTHYSDAIHLAGGIPFLIPYCDPKTNSINNYLDNIDGIVIPGGFYAMPDNWYQDLGEKSPYEKTPRFEFEETIIIESLKRDLPMLCICGGMQVLAGILDCKLTSDLTSSIENNIEHFDLDKPHLLKIEKDSLLYKIIGHDTISMNSHHREAIIKSSNKIKISARSEDNCIEAIELEGKKFVIGLQGHPEHLCSKKEQLKTFNPSHLIFKELIKNASRFC